MGRKIPAKKHRGVKDPIEQQARRFQSIKGKINAPPADPDDQPIPRSLTRLFAFQDKDKNKIKKQKRPKQAPSSDPVSGVGQNPIAHLKKLPGESGRGFSLRINSAIRALHDPQVEDYPQDLEVDDVKGEQMEAQRARRQRKASASKQRKGKAGTVTQEDRLTRGQKLTLRKNAKKLKAVEEARPEVEYERVAFGDITHAPPALPAPRHATPHHTAGTGAPRPGRRELLLSAMLPASNSKKRALPAAELMRRERARLDVVAAYRELKKRRQMEHSNSRKKKK